MDRYPVHVRALLENQGLGSSSEDHSTDQSPMLDPTTVFELRSMARIARKWQGARASALVIIIETELRRVKNRYLSQIRAMFRSLTYLHEENKCTTS